MRKFIVADPIKCTGCRICEVVCSATKEKAFNPRMSRIRMVRTPKVDTALTCLFCEKPPCVRSCPGDALTQSEENGVIHVDENKCYGCGWCIEACDFGALSHHKDKKVVAVCDLCEGQAEPQCIKYCPFKALELTTPDSFSEGVRKSKIMELFLEKEK